MTATTMPLTATEASVADYRPPLRARLSRLVLPVYTGLAVAYLFLPIAVMIAFSFNNPRGRQNITWQGFTLQNYVDVWSRPDITDPMVQSLIVAVVSTIIATALGTLIGLALTPPGAGHDQHPDLPAHGDPRDHHGCVAALAVGLAGRREKPDHDHRRPR